MGIKVVKNELLRTFREIPESERRKFFAGISKDIRKQIILAVKREETMDGEKQPRNKTRTFVGKSKKSTQGLSMVATGEHFYNTSAYKETSNKEMAEVAYAKGKSPATPTLIKKLEKRGYKNPLKGGLQEGHVKKYTVGLTKLILKWLRTPLKGKVD